MCVWSINIKGGRVYPVPPWCCLVRICVLPGTCMHPLVWPLFRHRPLSLFGFWSFFRRLDQFHGWGGVLVGGGVLIWCVGRLAEKLQSSPVFPLQSLHTDFVCRCPWSSDTPVCGLHQSDGNPTLDVSTRLRVGLFPLWCEATGYPFQGSRRLHPENYINRGDEGWEVSTLLEASLQVHILLTPLRLLQASLGGLLPIGLCISVHNTNVVNTVFPIVTEVPDQKVSLLFRGLCWSVPWVDVATGTGRLGFRPLRGKTLVYEGVVAYVRGGERPARQIRNPVTELIATRRDDATPIAIKGVSNREPVIAAVAVFGEVWGL